MSTFATCGANQIQSLLTEGRGQSVEEQVLTLEGDDDRHTVQRALQRSRE